MVIVLTTQEIINAYDTRQQNQCRLFYEYEKIAKLLGEKYSKTRWWHAGKHIPVPVQTEEWLKEKGLLPLTKNNPKTKLIAKVLGSTFGDGGIFGNLNGIFLSSSELDAVKEFGEDLKKIFGDEIEQNSRIIEGGEVDCEMLQERADNLHD